jgi:hypothetical protein
VGFWDGRHRVIASSPRTTAAASRRRQAFTARERPPAGAVGWRPPIPYRRKYGHVTDGQGKLAQSCRPFRTSSDYPFRFAARTASRSSRHDHAARATERTVRSSGAGPAPAQRAAADDRHASVERVIATGTGWAGVSGEAIRRPLSAPPAQGHRTPGKPRQRTGGPEVGLGVIIATAFPSLGRPMN